MARKKGKAKPSDLGSGQAARAAGTAVRRNRAVRRSADSSMRALEAALGRKRDNQSTDSNNR